jgi:hypothetical protein
MGEYEEARLRIISEGACPGLIKFLGESWRDNSLEEEIECLEAMYKLSQHTKNHLRMASCPSNFERYFRPTLTPGPTVHVLWSKFCEL